MPFLFHSPSTRMMKEDRMNAPDGPARRRPFRTKIVSTQCYYCKRACYRQSNRRADALPGINSSVAALLSVFNLTKAAMRPAGVTQRNKNLYRAYEQQGVEPFFPEKDGSAEQVLLPSISGLHITPRRARMERSHPCSRIAFELAADE
ncbi:hypothetical protein llap_7697 [Limosa lapponica baueri]|uniref:Uncharacterized protein n=1 Tax=Limosa lapponica baueri TaxID=1758121 RepID=A0A2I0U7L3_LIMLA|nr:hypothetical protein llap_7697 [Limosa lapponica baueri]